MLPHITRAVSKPSLLSMDREVKQDVNIGRLRITIQQHQHHHNSHQLYSSLSYVLTQSLLQPYYLYQRIVNRPIHRFSTMSSNVVFNNAHSQNNSSTSSAGSSHASSSGAASNNTNSTPAEAPRDGGDGNGNSETESLEELSRMDSGPGQTSPSQSGIARDAKQPLPQGQRRERRMANGEGDNNESFFDTDDQEDYTYHLNDPEPLCTKRCPHNCELWHPGSTPSGPRDLQGGLYCRKKKYIDHRRRDARVGTKKHIREYLRCVSPEDEDRPHCSSCLRGGAPDEQPSSSGQPDKKDGSKHQPAEYVGYIVGPIPAECKY